MPETARSFGRRRQRWRIFSGALRLECLRSQLSSAISLTNSAFLSADITDSPRGVKSVCRRTATSGAPSQSRIRGMDKANDDATLPWYSHRLVTSQKISSATGP